MSTLLHQLQHLKVAGQPSSLHVAAKKKPSLLFDHEEAATIDIEVIYDLGRNGLEELARIDISLHEYEENLFSEKCIGYERSTEGKEQLQQLDDTIGRFLRQLSPYLMLRAAHKCLEWLIRVFRITSYNVDNIMKCILPYHDTVLFARIVQLLPLKNKSSFWHWLRPSQKKASPLAKSTLIQHCISVPAFLNFICDMAEQGGNKIAVSFYCSTVIGVISAVGVLQEWLVVMVIPRITSGLKASHDHIKAANYIILAHMIQHTTLSDKVATSLLNLLAKNMSEGLVREGVMMMCHYCNCQQLRMFSTRAVKYLLDCPQLLPTLTELAGSHDVSTFSGLLMTSLITYHFDKMIGCHGDVVVPSTDMIVGVVKEIPLEEAIVVQCVRSLLEGYMKYRDVIGQRDIPVSLDGVHHYCEPIVKAIDTRYSSVLGSVIGDHVTSCEPCHQKWLQEFITLLLPSVKHHVAMDTSVVTAVGIHHSNPDVRRLTFSNMCQQINDGETIEDNQFVSSAILSHLHDDSNLVVENVVSCCIQQEEMLHYYIPTESLIDALFSVLSRARSHDPISDQCLQNVMSLLISVDHEQFTDSMLLRLLPHLLYHYHDNVKVIQSLGVAIATSSLAQTHPLLIGSDKMFCSEGYQIQGGQSDMMNNANCLLIGYFVERLASMDTNHLTNMVTLLLNLCCHDDNTIPTITSELLFPVAMVTLLLTYPLPQSLNLKIATCLVSMVSSFMPYCVIENVTPSLDNAISILVHKKGSHRKQTKVLGNLILWVITMVTKHLITVTDIKTSLWLDISSCDSLEYHQYCVVLLILYNILVQLLSDSQGNDHCQSIMRTMISIHFQGRGTLLRFLAMIWCAERDIKLSIKIASKLSMFSLHTQISSLQYALVFLEAMGPGAVLAVGGMPQCPMVPALLVALLKPDKLLRQAALKCFHLIHASIDITGIDIMNVDTPFLYLCDVILHHQVELLADHNAIVVAMAKEMSYATIDTKQSVITAVVQALMYHVTSCETPTHIQYSILTILNDAHHKVKFDGVLKILRRNIGTMSSSDSLSDDQGLMGRLIECYNINNTSYMTRDAVIMMTRLLNISSVQCLILNQVTAEFYHSLKIQYQQILLSALLDCCLDTSTTPTASADIVNVINKLPLNTSNVLNELDNKQLLTVDKSAGSKKTKRLKLDTPTEEEFPLDKSWQRIGIVLDAVPGSVSSQECYQLVPTLFQLLESCLELGPMLHHVQLQLLHVMCWVVTTIMADMGVDRTREILPESQFNIDLIIQAIRSSSSTPQIQQQSLSLLSVSASLYPVRILHNIMSIFTFMGVYLSNHDDQYSFEVVLTAMDKLLPMLMSSDNIGHTPKKSSNQITVTTIEIIRVFSDAIEHIPDHRQLIVFQKLVNILGVDNYLHVTLLMLLGKQVDKQQQDNQKKTISEFCKHLSTKFPVANQVMSLHRVIEHISHAADVQCVATGSTRKVAMVTAGEIFSLYTHSTKQIQLFKLSCLSLIINVLSCDLFTSKILHNQLCKEQELMFISLLQTTISYIVTINAHHSSGKFYDLVIKKCYTIVDHVTHPLTTKSYIKVMSQLITPEAQSDIQRRSLDIIRTHFTSSSQHFAVANVKDMLALLPLLNQLIQHKQLPVNNKASAILLITTIMYSIGSGYHDNIIEVMPHLLKIIKKKSTHNQVLACSIKCISAMVKRLGGHFIPHLPNTIPLIIAKVSSHDSSVATAAVEGLTSVIEVLPKFLTPYISDIIIQGCRTVAVDGNNATLVVAAKHLREQLATHIPSRLLVPSMVCCYDNIAAVNELESLLAFLHILNVSIGKMAVSDVSSHGNELTDLFLKLLQYRSTQQQELLNIEVEDKCVECFTELIVKMSENIFRPVFLRISDWATQSKNKHHLISFYHLADQIAGKLKGLFLLFAGHIIPNCIELLNNINGGDRQLQQYLFPCLTKCFHYGATNSFVSTNRFNALLEPLVNQVHHITDEDTVQKYLVPCLVEFAAATTDDTHWKALNHQLLLCSKDDDTKVRQSVLHILMAIYSKLGESLLIMLPETIPFLAELLEDDDEQVEQLCQKFIKIIEELLGESIQQYF